jgi:hypothetical protein
MSAGNSGRISAPATATRRPPRFGRSSAGSANAQFATPSARGAAGNSRSYRDRRARRHACAFSGAKPIATAGNVRMCNQAAVGIDHLGLLVFTDLRGTGNSGDFSAVQLKSVARRDDRFRGFRKV